MRNAVQPLGKILRTDMIGCSLLDKGWLGSFRFEIVGVIGCCVVALYVQHQIQTSSVNIIL